MEKRQEIDHNCQYEANIAVIEALLKRLDNAINDHVEDSEYYRNKIMRHAYNLTILNGVIGAVLIAIVGALAAVLIK